MIGLPSIADRMCQWAGWLRLKYTRIIVGTCNPKLAHAHSMRATSFYVAQVFIESLPIPFPILADIVAKTTLVWFFCALEQGKATTPCTLRLIPWHRTSPHTVLTSDCFHWLRCCHFAFQHNYPTTYAQSKVLPHVASSWQISGVGLFLPPKKFWKALPRPKARSFHFPTRGGRDSLSCASKWLLGLGT